jgi:hypothetical protein
MTITALPDEPSRSDTPAVFITKADAFLAALSTLVTEVNAATLAMNLNATTDTSASSVAIGTGAKTFTVTAGKSFLGGMYLVIADTAAPSTNFMVGQVTSYSGTSLVMNMLYAGGSGTKTAWTISQSAVGVAGGGVVAPLSLNLPMINGYVEWAISASALTASIKTLAGNDPSATDPVYISFRDPTLTTAGYYVRAVTAATSITASSGSTLGTVSAQASRIRAVAVDDGGTVVLGLYNTYNSSTKSLAGINEGAVYSTTAEGGAGAADSAQVIYTTAAKTSKAVRELSYMDSTQATAGTWATALTSKVQVSATTPKVGAIIQLLRSVDGEVATGPTTIPVDDTIPQSSEGDQYMSQTVTPQAAANLLIVSHFGTYGHSSTSSSLQAAIFQDAAANALAVTANGRDNTANIFGSVAIDHLMVANTLSATTFKVRVGSAGAGTTTFNGASSSRRFGGVMASYLEIKEIMA